jgi:hypothetical protein
MKKIIALILLFQSFNLLAQERKNTATITVKGVSNLKVQPDEGYLNLNASFIGLDVNQAMLGLEKKTKELIKQIIASGLNEKDIKTINFQLNKHSVYRRGATKDSGYFATQSLQIKFTYSKEKIAKILNTFSDSKADYNMYFNFMLSDTLRKQSEAVLIKIAVKDAKTKATTLSNESGVKIKSIKGIEYGIVANNQPYPMLKTRSMMMADENGQGAMQGFTPDDIELNDEVLIIWEIE